MFYKIGSIADVQKLHLRYLDDNTCFSEKFCYALKASSDENDVMFFSDEDAYVLNAAALKSLSIDKKVTKATKIELDEEHTKKLLIKFYEKENKKADYIKQTQDLS